MSKNSALSADCTWEKLYFQKLYKNTSVKQQITEADEKNKNLETELLSKTKVSLYRRGVAWGSINTF